MVLPCAAMQYRDTSVQQKKPKTKARPQKAYMTHTTPTITKSGAMKKHISNLKQ